MNEQKLRENNKNLKIENDKLIIKIKELEKNAPLLEKSTKKVDDLGSQLEESKNKVSGLSIEVESRDSSIKNMQGQISALEKKVGKASGPFPRLPVRNSSIQKAVLATEIGISEDEQLQLYYVEMKDKNIPACMLKVRMKNGKCTSADFSRWK